MTYNIENAIATFNKNADEIKRYLEKVKASLVLGNTNVINVTDDIRELTNELNELDKEANKLIESIDELRLELGTNNVSMTPIEIKNKVTELKTRLKELKVSQVNKYNARVEYINKNIKELKLLTNIDNELINKINNLSFIDKCNIEIRDYRTIKYLDYLDYNKLIQVSNLITEIQKEVNINISKNDLDIDQNHIFEEILRISKASNVNIDDINNISKLIDEFIIKLENNKDKLTEEEYNSYSFQIKNQTQQFEYLKFIFTKRESDNYNSLLKKIETFDKQLMEYLYLIDSLKGHFVESAISIIEDNIKDYQTRIEYLKKEIEDNKKKGILDENQYNNLLNKLKQNEDTIKTSLSNIKDPRMIKDVDVFAFLNKGIDGLEQAIDNLANKVNNLEKPIKDKEIRKQIDISIKKIEENIIDIEKQLEKYKNEDTNKYNNTLERLNNIKDNFDKVGKYYRQKCPLLVKSVKDAKSLYKKTPKIVLMSAGLAGLCILYHSVLIPAIIHSNIIIASKIPFLKAPLLAINNLIGGLIGAKKTISGGKILWTLSNGVKVGSYTATTSLLKGIAVSGISSTALVGSLIIAIKKLIEKIKITELKEQLSKEKIKEKINLGKDKMNKETNKLKEQVREKLKDNKKTSTHNDNFIKDYDESGLTLEEYCKNKNLTKEEIAILEYFDKRLQDNENKRGGR